jgi:hypothetical protein
MLKMLQNPSELILRLFGGSFEKGKSRPLREGHLISFVAKL